MRAVDESGYVCHFGTSTTNGQQEARDKSDQVQDAQWMDIGRCRRVDNKEEVKGQEC